MKFEELELNNNVLDALYDMRFDTCTPVQEKCIPEILKKHDVMGIAQTGTGKTAAYLLPIMSMLDSGNYPNETINCLIMAPTRELAQQIDQAMQGFGYYLNGVSSVAVYGGNDGNRYEQELKSLRLGADVVIATPGRFISHMSMGNVDLSKVSFFVLDEADRMLDMGFSEDIMTIAKKLPKTCQTIMFSATMPEKINQLARTLLKNPVEIKLSVSKPAEKIQQKAYVCSEIQKIGILETIFQEGNLQRVIVFCGSKQKVKQVSQSLKRIKINCNEMHSDLDQAQRDEVMFRFKSAQTDVLVATDIVARGIDIDDIAMVINFDVPHDTEDYVHRIGRTARADRDGKAITLVSKEDINYFQQIEKFLEKDIEKLPIPQQLGEAPEYIASEKGDSNRSTARSRRHKDRYQHARKHTSRRQNTEEQSNAASRNKVQNAVEQIDKQSDNKTSTNEKRSNNHRRHRPNRYQNNENTHQNDAQNDTNKRREISNSRRELGELQTRNHGEERNNRRRRPNHRNNESSLKSESTEATRENRPNNRRRPNNYRRGKGNENRAERSNKPTKKASKIKQTSGLKALIEKPLKWLRGLGKK